MKGDSRTPRHLSVLVPSLSTDILWKPAPASRVRFAAHKPRALDAAAAFLQDPPLKKAKGRSSKVTTPAASKRPSPASNPDPSTLAYSSQKLVLTLGATAPRRLEAIELVRQRRAEFNQELAYNSRPFVLCGLPTRRPTPRTLKHSRRNGRFTLEIIGHPDYGLLSAVGCRFPTGFC